MPSRLLSQRAPTRSRDRPRWWTRADRALSRARSRAPPRCTRPIVSSKNPSRYCASAMLGLSAMARRCSASASAHSNDSAWTWPMATCASASVGSSATARSAARRAGGNAYTHRRGRKYDADHQVQRLRRRRRARTSSRARSPGRNRSSASLHALSAPAEELRPRRYRSYASKSVVPIDVCWRPSTRRVVLAAPTRSPMQSHSERRRRPARALERLLPEHVSVGGARQFGGDAHAIARASHGAVEHRADIERLSYLGALAPLPLKRAAELRPASRSPGNARERGRQLVGDPFGEVGVRRVAADGLERKHGERFSRSRRTGGRPSRRRDARRPIRHRRRRATAAARPTITAPWRACSDATCGPDGALLDGAAFGVVALSSAREQLGRRRGPLRRILLQAAHHHVGERRRESPAFFVAIGAGVSVRCAAMSCCAVVRPANGCAPASSSYAITPHA